MKNFYSILFFIIQMGCAGTESQDTRSEPIKSPIARPVGTNKILALGGRTGTNLNPYFLVLNDIYSSYDMTTWNVLSPNNPSSTLKWSPRANVEAVYFQDQYWITGGYSEPMMTTPNTFNEIWSSYDGVTWTNRGLAPMTRIPLPTGVRCTEFFTSADCYLHNRLVVLNGSMFLIESGEAGWFGSDNFQILPAKVWATQNGMNWELKNANAPFGPRIGMSVVSFQGKIFLMGGSSFYGSATWPGGGYAGIDYTDVWSSADGITWTQETNNAPWIYGSSDGRTVSYNNKMFFITHGYFCSSPCVANQIFSSTDGVQWTEISHDLPSFVFSYGQTSDAIVANGKIWISYHNDEPGILSRSLYSSSNGSSWTQMQNVPWSSRFGMKLVAETHQCSDGIDNDGDGLIDFPNDPGCSSVTDNDEYNVVVPPPACALTSASLTVPASTTLASLLSLPVSWNTNGCTKFLIYANSGSYTQAHTSINSTGTHTFIGGPMASYSITDTGLDVTLFATDGIHTYSITKRIPIVDAPTPVANQCPITSLTATPNPVSITGNHQTTLSWIAPAGCLVAVQYFEPDLVQNHYVGTGFFSSTGSVTVTLDKSATFYVSTTGGTSTTSITTTMVVDAKAFDVKVQ